jgi:chromate transporter
VRSALIPVTTGLIIASDIVMAQAAGITWAAIAVTGAAAIVVLTTRLNPLWLLAAGGALGGLDFLV